MIKNCTKSLISLLLITSLSTCVAFAQTTSTTSSPITLGQSKYLTIKTDAQKFLQKYKSNVKLDDPIELYDANNEVIDLFFADKTGGYVIMDTEDESVPEFSPKSNNNFINDRSKKYYYNGPTNYMEEKNNKIVDSTNKEEIGTLSDLKAKLKDNNTYRTVKNTSKSNQSLIKDYSSSPTFSVITGTVPSYNYNKNNNCGSTAAAMWLMWYDKYISDDYVPTPFESQTNLIDSIMPYIEAGKGSYPRHEQDGLYNWLKYVGKNVEINLTYANLGSIMGRVSNNQPYILGITGHPNYKEHWATGYGYYSNYAIVNDGWGSSGIYIDMKYTDFIIY